METSKTAKKDIKQFLREMKVLHNLTKKDLTLMELWVIAIYKQGIIDVLENQLKETA